MEKTKVSQNVQFSTKPTHEQVYEYFQSIKTLKEMYWKAYEWDKPRHTPELHLVATRRIAEQITERLAERREEARKQRTILDKQWHHMYHKQTELKQNLKKMNAFVKTNIGKRERAVLIAADEAQIIVERTEQVDDLIALMQRLEATKKEMDTQIGMHRFYEKYLEEVAAVSADFNSVNELLNRYETLSDTKRELGLRQDATLNELEAARAHMVKINEEYSLTILGLNNRLANLNARYSSAVNKAMHWESLVWAIRRYSFEKYAEINQVKKSCWNIYLLMCQRKGETPKLRQNAFEQQLIFIKQTLRELATINRQAKKVVAKGSHEAIGSK